MSEQNIHEPGRHGQILERDRGDVFDAAKPLPSGDDALIEDLSEDEDRTFLAAILDA
jgi:hypothetical protein